MASPSRQAPLGGSGLLQGSRARSYGSLVQSACSPVRERRLEHQLAPGDTLAGLALKYGVTVSFPGLRCGQLVRRDLFLWRMLWRFEAISPEISLMCVFSDLSLSFCFPISGFSLSRGDTSCPVIPVGRGSSHLLYQSRCWRLYIH